MQKERSQRVSLSVTCQVWSFGRIESKGSRKMANDLAAQIVAASITAEELGTDRMLVQLKRRDGVTLR